MSVDKKVNPVALTNLFNNNCINSTVSSEWSLHQLSPYIGKVKSSIAKFLVENFTNEGDTVFDPFCGAGTIPLEAWTLGRHTIANDLNKYAYVLTNAKLFPPPLSSAAFQQIEDFDSVIQKESKHVDLTSVPKWVSDFFHPKTLQEIIVWMNILQKENSWFLLSCLLGILHHQRPGFLSFPSSHTVPYLRVNKFPQKEYSTLYEYRSVKDRLINKVKRSLKRQPYLDNAINRVCYNQDAYSLLPNQMIDAIITSPPYMRQLDYARDNRLRLWFLGVNDYKALDAIISPKEIDFIQIITNCLFQWNNFLKHNGMCVLFLGDNYSKKYNQTLPQIIETILVEQIGNFKRVFKHESVIPTNRRVRRSYNGNKVETIVAFKKI